MKYSIIWSPEAKKSFENNSIYLQETWSNKEVRSFIDRVEHIVNLISKHPKIFTYLPAQDAYRCVVVNHVSFFFRLRNHQVELQTFWDNRMDQEKLKT